MHLGMVAVMNAAIDLEDPFSTEGVDGVYPNESLYEVEQVGILPWIFSDLLGALKGVFDKPT